MSAYQIRRLTTWDGVRRIYVWWNPCRWTRDQWAPIEKVEGSPFTSPTDADEAIANDRHRRAGEL